MTFPRAQQVREHLQRRAHAFVSPDARILAGAGHGVESLADQGRHVQQPGDPMAAA